MATRKGSSRLESLFEEKNRITSRVPSEDKLNDDVFKKALEVWGKEEQFWMMVEEAGELITAINQVRRGRIDPLNMMEEVVDVAIVAKQLRFIDPDLYDMIYAFKVNKIRRKLGMEEE
jgi:hypothetical protein